MSLPKVLLRRIFAVVSPRKVVSLAQPPLVELLTSLEQHKGSPLCEEEVLAACSTAAFIQVRELRAREIALLRGYDDIDPQNAWAEWQDYRLNETG